MRNPHRGGRRNIAAGQEEANCRPISYREREQLWRDAVAIEERTRKPGCANGDLGKAGLAVLRSLLFDFLSMRTGACFPRVAMLQAKICPWYSRASIFRALDRLEAAGVLVRIHRRARSAGKIVQRASLYVFAKITEAEQAMAAKAKALAKATARAIRPALWPRSGSQSARVPSENPVFISGERGKPAPEASKSERAAIGLRMSVLLASLRTAT